MVLKLANANSKRAKEDSIMREIIGQSRQKDKVLNECREQALSHLYKQFQEFIYIVSINVFTFHVTFL